MPIPADPKIYHITHVDNLPGIVSEGGLLSDAVIIARGGPKASIGMSSIKRRRIESCAVHCHPGTRVGEYVPFYFCPRSVMLYVIYRGNHPGLTYAGGQEPIVHLEADLNAVIGWADERGHRWAFSLSNASAKYTQFRSHREDLSQLNWPAIMATDFRDPEVKEAKQAEFLVYERFPWDLVVRIGVYSASVRSQVEAVLETASHRPPVVILPGWYY